MENDFKEVVKSGLLALVQKVSSEAYKAGAIRQPNLYDFTKDVDSIVESITKAHARVIENEKNNKKKTNVVNVKPPNYKINGKPVTAEEFMAIDKELSEMEAEINKLFKNIMFD